MEKLEQELYRLGDIKPSKRFLKTSKERLFLSIQMKEDEVWVKKFFKSIGKIASPTPEFKQQARVRLMESIPIKKQHVLRGLFAFKRVMASTLVMMIAVMSTLFFVEGGQVASASDKTFIEVLSGHISIKHADQLAWDDTTVKTALSVGDLVQLREGSEAVIYFFDDTQLRLTENTLLLINQLAISPNYGRQGIINVALQKGQVWAQVLNVDDGYAQFTLTTRNSIINTLNGTFDVSSNLDQPTVLRVFKNQVDFEAYNPRTQVTATSLILNKDKKAMIDGLYQPVIDVSNLDKEDELDSWVTLNLERDRDHLMALKDRELESLRLVTGSIPGDMLYPIKKAKERLKLALSFGAENLTEAQIDMANERLNEAIMLFQQGETKRANEALLVYQNIARSIVDDGDVSVAHRIITPHQKTLVAALPGDIPVGAIRETLHQTKELLASDPLEKANVRLESAVERLHDITTMLEVGNTNAAKDALTNYSLSEAHFILDEIAMIANEADQKDWLTKVLKLQREQESLLDSIKEVAGYQMIHDTQLLGMLKGAEDDLKKQLSVTLTTIEPLMPELVYVPQTESVVDSQIRQFVERVNIYKTSRGQQNQIDRLLADQPKYASDLYFLKSVREGLTSRARDIINVKILQLESKIKVQKHKDISRKIDRTKKLRD